MKRGGVETMVRLRTQFIKVFLFLLYPGLGMSWILDDYSADVDYVEGIDISHYQGEIDWYNMTSSQIGKQFIIAKATEGSTYKDAKFLQNIRKARASGFSVLGGYHFVRFDEDAPVNQMNNFLQQLKDADLLADHKSIIALDVEEHLRANYTTVQNVVMECVQLLKDKNITPYIYTRTSFWDVHVPVTPDVIKQCPLWIARYRETAPSDAELPNGWKRWDIWQYSEKGTVAGIKGNVDLNKMKT